MTSKCFGSVSTVNPDARRAMPERHDARREKALRRHAKTFATHLASEQGTVAVILGGSVICGPVDAGTDVDLWLITSGSSARNDSDWDVQRDGIIVDIHRFALSELNITRKHLHDVQGIAYLLRSSWIGDQLNHYEFLALRQTGSWQESLATLLACRWHPTVLRELACRLLGEASVQLSTVDSALHLDAVADAQQSVRAAGQLILLAILVRRGAVIRGAKKRIEIAEAYLPDQNLAATLELLSECVGLTRVTAEDAQQLTADRLRWRGLLLAEPILLKSVVLSTLRARQQNAVDYYAPLIRAGFHRGVINHMRAISGLATDAALVSQTLAHGTDLTPLHSFLGNVRLSRTFRSLWAELMALNAAPAQCRKWRAAFATVIAAEARYLA